MKSWLLTLATVCFITASLHAEDAPPAAPRDTLKILTYNVLADEVRVKERVPALFKILQDSDADLIVMQEVAPWFFKLLYEQEWLKKYHLKTEDGENAVRGQYAILSKTKIQSTHFQQLSGRQRRGVFVAKLKINGRTLAVATAHLESYLEDGPVRARQLDEIFPLLKDADDAIFLGDFNFGDGEEPDTSHLDKKYMDVWRELLPKDPGYTWNIETSDMAKEGSFPKEASRRIDRILLRSEVWKPEKAAIIGDKPVVEGKKDLFPSDHFGLTATLKWQK